jgi:small subunit ribosomal protein S6
MRGYELVTVFKPELTGEKLKKAVGDVEKMLVGVKGKIKKVTGWGKKELAYPIKGKMQGHYYLHLVELSSESLTGIEKKLRLNEDLLRYLLVRL